MSSPASSGVGSRLDALASRTRVVWWATFVAVFGLAGLWALASPLASPPDEPSHLNYAAALVRGDIIAEDVQPGDPLAPGNMDTFARHLSAMRVPTWVDDTYVMSNCVAFQPGATADCAPALGDSTEMTTTLHQFGRYPPGYYMAVGWPTLFLTGERGYHAVRLVSAALCAALVASAMASAAQLPGRRRFAVIGVALAVTPMTVFLFGSVSSSGFEIAAALAAWLSLLDLAHRRGRPPTRLVVRVAVTCSLFLTARPSGLAYLAMAATVVAVAALTPTRVRELLRERSVQVGAGVVGVTTLAALAWLIVRQPDAGLMGRPDPGLSYADAISYSWSQTIPRANQLIGVFGWLDTGLPQGVYDTWFGLVWLSVLAALWFGRWRERLALVVVLVASILVPVILEARVASQVGYIWQGRYTLPIAVGVPVLACCIIGHRAGRHTRVLGVAGVIAAVLIGGMQLIAHTRGLDRYVHGLPADLFAYLTTTGWRPPLGRKGQLGLGIAVTSAWAAVVGVLALSRRPEPADADAAQHPPDADGPTDGDPREPTLAS